MEHAPPILLIINFKNDKPTLVYFSSMLHIFIKLALIYFNGLFLKIVFFH